MIDKYYNVVLYNLEKYSIPFYLKAKIEIKNHGGGIFRIKAEIENAGFLPTVLQHGVTSRSVKPTMVQLGVDPKKIISGNNKTNSNADENAN